jgi:hypothetical protein
MSGEKRQNNVSAAHIRELLSGVVVNDEGFISAESLRITYFGCGVGDGYDFVSEWFGNLNCELA